MTQLDIGFVLGQKAVLRLKLVTQFHGEVGYPSNCIIPHIEKIANYAFTGAKIWRKMTLKGEINLKKKLIDAPLPQKIS